MHGECSMGEGRQRRLARGVPTAAARIVPAAVLLLLPKCPICVAVWLTAVTGITVSVAAGAWVRELIVVVCVAALGASALRIVQRRKNLRDIRVNPRPE
ncbi:MAG TPA: hypothetical protein VKU01_28915 [Bryobacteraceae bacterium]|nr:hypothetical protein [Bryobacteraceae bacterium]